MRMSRHFLIRRIGSKADIAHIQIPSALDSLTAYQLLEKIQGLAQDGLSKYIINLEDVQYISSTGIEIIYLLQHELHEEYGTVLIANIPHKIYKLFDQVGVMTILQVTDSLEQAVERLSAS